MKVEFLTDAIRLLPESPEENKTLVELFNIRTSIKAGAKPKVLVQQLVDRFGDPVADQYFMLVHGDPKKDEFTETIEVPEKD